MRFVRIDDQYIINLGHVALAGWETVRGEDWREPMRDLVLVLAPGREVRIADGDAARRLWSILVGLADGDPPLDMDRLLRAEAEAIREIDEEAS